jgi:dihydroorotate dehydrogenase (fumarate)
MDLTSDYMGLKLANPLVASASPLNAEIGNIRRLEDAGAAAIVLPSIFQEQIEAEMRRFETLTSVGIESFPEASGYFPAPSQYEVGSDQYIDLIRRARAAVALPIIASLNGSSDEGWIDYATEIERAGASALELNIYFIPADLTLTGAAVEARYCAIVRSVRTAISIPLAVKMSPYFSAIGDMAQRLTGAGADALVLFNRFYQPDIDLARLRLSHDLNLSTPSEIRLPLLWIALLHGRLKVSLAASTGVNEVEEIVKFLLVGADAVMTTSALLRHGIGYMRHLIAGLESWLEARNLESLATIRGAMSRVRTSEPAAFERANYIKIFAEYPHR